MKWFVQMSDSLPCQDAKFTPVEIIEHTCLGASFLRLPFTHNLIHTPSLKQCLNCEMRIKKKKQIIQSTTMDDILFSACDGQELIFRLFLYYSVCKPFFLWSPRSIFFNRSATRYKKKFNHNIYTIQLYYIFC